LVPYIRTPVPLSGPANPDEIYRPVDAVNRPYPILTAGRYAIALC
jgi:hypothetical protein